MELTVQRSTRVAELALPGEMTIDGMHAAWTLENADKAIPAGRYQIVLYPSPHFARMMPLLKDVPGRADILIHWGTFPENYEGCIGVGELRDPATGEIFNTQKKWQELILPIEAAIETEGCWITVRDRPAGQETLVDSD